MGNNFFKILKAIFSKAPELSALPPEEKPSLFSFDEDGFLYPFKTGSEKIRWDDIEKLEGYKRDRMTVDDVCMEVTWDGRRVVFSEEMPGWEALQRKIREKFPQIPGDWEEKIKLPAFAKNLTVLYEREGEIK